MIGTYRASGPLRWLLDKMSINRWSLVGAIAAEERCVAVARELTEVSTISECSLLQIHDEVSTSPQKTRLFLSQRRKEFNSILNELPNVFDMNLMSDLPELGPLYDKIERASSKHVILDISCLPKRFFFYLLRRLIESKDVETLVVTVTSPKSYGKELSRDAGRWEFLPSFGRESASDAQPLLIIGVGYQHLNLLDIVDEGNPASVRLLMPFPSKPPGGIRNWEFVRNIEQQKKFNLKPSDVIRVHPYSTSLAYDILDGQCNSRTEEVWLAPFGPKSISLAMALFSLACEKNGRAACVGYTQPPAYSATYSMGTEVDDSNVPVVHAYVIKVMNRCLY